jgi:hypothetical protein
VFLAGDAVQLIREPVRTSLAGLGTGALREHFDKVIAGGGRTISRLGPVPHEGSAMPTFRVSLTRRLVLLCWCGLQWSATRISSTDPVYLKGQKRET